MASAKLPSSLYNNYNHAKIHKNTQKSNLNDLMIPKIIANRNYLIRDDVFVVCTLLKQSYILYRFNYGTFCVGIRSFVLFHLNYSNYFFLVIMWFNLRSLKTLSIVGKWFSNLTKIFKKWCYRYVYVKK